MALPWHACHESECWATGVHTDNPQPSMSSYAGIGGNSLYVPHPIPAGADEGYSMHLQKIVPDCTELLMSHWMRITCSNRRPF